MLIINEDNYLALCLLAIRYYLLLMLADYISKVILRTTYSYREALRSNIFYLYN